MFEKSIQKIEEIPQKFKKIEESKTFDLRRVVIGGAISAGISFLGITLVNISSGAEAVKLMEAMLPSVRLLASGSMTASATVLALMLTMVSLSGSREEEFDASHYERIGHIARTGSMLFAASIFLLLLVSIPIQDAESLSTRWYRAAYYIVLAYAAALGGTFTSVIIMLYDAVRDMVDVMHPQAESRIVHTHDQSAQNGAHPESDLSPGEQMARAGRTSDDEE